MGPLIYMLKIPITCEGQNHLIYFREGRLTLANHLVNDQVKNDEAILEALGKTYLCPCKEILNWWINFNKKDYKYRGDYFSFHQYLGITVEDHDYKISGFYDLIKTLFDLRCRSYYGDKEDIVFYGGDMRFVRKAFRKIFHKYRKSIKALYSDITIDFLKQTFIFFKNNLDKSIHAFIDNELWYDTVYKKNWHIKTPHKLILSIEDLHIEAMVKSRKQYLALALSNNYSDEQFHIENYLITEIIKSGTYEIHPLITNKDCRLEYYMYNKLKPYIAQT